MMTMKMIVATVIGLIVGAPAQAQVIEVDSSGGSRTYDGPTVFSADGGDPIVRDAEPGKVLAAAPAEVLTQTALAYGVDPKLMHAVAWQESRGRMSAISSKGALGVMQLMPGTAAELGVNPADLADNIRGGAMYLRRQLDRFGSVPLALAAYNAGPGAVIRYGGVPPYRETRDYVSKILQRWSPGRPSLTAMPPVAVAESAPAPFIIEVPE